MLIIKKIKNCVTLCISRKWYVNLKFVWEVSKVRPIFYLKLNSNNFFVLRTLIVTWTKLFGAKTFSRLTLSATTLQPGHLLFVPKIFSTQGYYSWGAGYGSSSFWFNNWSSDDRFGNHVYVIDIHDLHLSLKDVFSINDLRTQTLYTIFPPAMADYINTTHFRFNTTNEETLGWAHNKNGSYTTKSGYAWFLSLTDTTVESNSHHSWSWIWRLQVPEKYKFLIWLACQNASMFYLCFIIGIWRSQPPVLVAKIMKKLSFIVFVIVSFLVTFGTKLFSQVTTFSLHKMRMTGSKLAPQTLAPLSFLLVFGGFGGTAT